MEIKFKNNCNEEDIETNQECLEEEEKIENIKYEGVQEIVNRLKSGKMRGEDQLVSVMISLER